MGWLMQVDIVDTTADYLIISLISNQQSNYLVQNRFSASYGSAPFQLRFEGPKYLLTSSITILKADASLRIRSWRSIQIVERQP